MVVFTLYDRMAPGYQGRRRGKEGPGRHFCDIFHFKIV